MFGADKSYLSICIQDTAIKVAAVKSSGVVEKIARATAASTSTDDLSKVLKFLLTGFNRKSSVICAIPASAATSKSIEVPSVDPKEIKSIINLQASRHTPYSREEVLIGHVSLGAVSNGNTKVLLVIVQRNVIKERLTVLEKCGLVPDKVAFVPEGVGRLYAKGLNLKNNSFVGLIDLNQASTNFFIVGRGCVSFARNIALGLKDLEGSAGPGALIEEINKSLAAYQSEDTEPVGSFVVTSDQESVKGLLPALQEALKVDVRISPYISLVKANAVRIKLQKDFADDSFLDVIAPVVNIAKAEINFLPDEIIMKRTVERQKDEAIQAGIEALVMMLLIGGVLMSKIYFKDEYLNKNLRGHYADQKEEVAKLQDRMESTRIVREYIQGRMMSLDLINELTQVTPKEIYLTGLSMDEEGNVALTGVSQSMSQVFSYEKSLDDSPMFVDAKTKSTSSKKDGAKDIAVFEMSFKFGTSSDKKTDEKADGKNEPKKG